MSAVALALLLAAAPQTTAAERAWAESRKADTAVLEGDVERAERLYRQALRESENFPAARLGLGHIAMARERWAQALEEYGAARDGFERAGLALAAIERERHAAATADIERLRSEIAEAEASLHGGKLPREEPIAELDERILRARIADRLLRIRQLEAVRPPRADGLVVPGEVDYHRGNALFRLGRISEAVAAWETSAGKLPGFAPLHNNLAVAYLSLERHDDAARSVAEAERLGFVVDERIKMRLRRPGA